MIFQPAFDVLRGLSLQQFLGLVKFRTAFTPLVPSEVCFGVPQQSYDLCLQRLEPTDDRVLNFVQISDLLGGRCGSTPCLVVPGLVALLYLPRRLAKSSHLLSLRRCDPNPSIKQFLRPRLKRFLCCIQRVRRPCCVDLIQLVVQFPQLRFVRMGLSFGRWLLSECCRTRFQS